MATTDKYDRQTRLWGAHGQKALATSRICLLTAGPTGTESLKNLVLPGCGFVCVVDGETVTEADVGNNFFVDAESVGKPRAEVVLAQLLEMNPDVKGEAHNTTPAELIGSNPAFFEGFSLVIASQLRRETLLALSEILWGLDIALITCRSYGLIGHMRIARPVHQCLESKDSQAKPDLRIANPFPALEAMAADLDLDTVKNDVHRHIPYPVLLVLLMRKYEAEKGARPANFRQRKEFARWVDSQRRHHVVDENGTAVWEANFDEAVENASAACLKAPIPADVQDVLSDAKLDALQATDADFWFLARALRDFRDTEGEGERLPVSAALPDLTTTTALYLRLVNAYKEQEAADRAAFEAHLSAALSAAGRGEPVEEEAVGRFLSSCRAIKVVRYRSLAAELDGDAAAGDDSEAAAAADASSSSSSAGAAGGSAASSSSVSYTGAVAESVEEAMMSVVQNEGEDDDEFEARRAAEEAMCPLLWQVMLRAADDFEAEHGRFPGAGADADLEADAAALAAFAARHAEGYGVSGRIGEKHAQEMTRYGACEPHAIAAVVGAITSQEAIKLLTGQYVPINNTYVFNGIASKAEQAEL